MGIRAISTYSMWSPFWNCRKAYKWSHHHFPSLLVGEGATI